MKLNARELATVLAASRYWQRKLTKDQIEILASDEWQIIATDGDTVDPLNPAEIDDLCKRLNCADETPKAAVCGTCGSDNVKAGAELAEIVASISSFDRRCKLNEYTDTDEVWGILYSNRNRARRALRAIKGPS